MIECIPSNPSFETSTHFATCGIEPTETFSESNNPGLAQMSKKVLRLWKLIYGPHESIRHQNCDLCPLECRELEDGTDIIIFTRIVLVGIGVIKGQDHRGL